MEEEQEINVLSEPNVSDNLSLVTENTDLLNCEYTVHPQWLLDRPSANPDCWYNNSTESSLVNSREDLEEECIRHITTENAITDESGWTEKEKNLLERGIEIFGKSTLRLAQFIATKTPSEIKYYLKNFYNELHPSHSKKTSMQKECTVENVFVDTQIPCMSKQVVGNRISVHSVEKCAKSSKMFKRNMQKKRQKDVKLSLSRDKINTVTVENKNFKAGLLLSKGEEIVNIKKNSTESSDSDVEIDVETDCGSSPKHVSSSLIISSETIEPRTNKCQISSDFSRDASLEIQEYLREVSKDIPNLEGSDSIISQLSSLQIPNSELVLEKNVITDVEKIIQPEFFVKNSKKVKSPEVYLSFRNLIISRWKSKKPQYITKTDVRKTLTRPIDNKTLSKMHSFLEQIGAINYGCDRVRYIRPLHRLLDTSLITNKIKNVKPRRFKKKFLNNGEGGCTVSHGANGEIIDTTIVNEDPAPPKLKQFRKQPTYLIYCKPFIQEYKYRVKLQLSTLLLMDFHAHSSLSEVMGLIGGYWSPLNKTLLIAHYEPCENIASSTTHCDMCPVSQAASAEKIHGLKMNLLGWFHSHPTFAPEPSQQDLDTQRSLQEWIGAGNPCVGIILAPFNRPNVLTPSEFRCMIVEKSKEEDVYLPYKFKVEIQCSDFNLDEFLTNILRIRDFITSKGNFQDDKFKIGFTDPYFHDPSISYTGKFLSSVRMTLEKNFPDDENIRQKITSSIQKVCSDINM